MPFQGLHGCITLNTIVDSSRCFPIVRQCEREQHSSKTALLHETGGEDAMPVLSEQPFRPVISELLMAWFSSRGDWHLRFQKRNNKC